MLFFQFSKSYTLGTYLACIYRTCIIRSHILSSKMHTRSHDICFCWIFYSIFFYQIRIFLDSWCFEMSHYMTQYKQTRTRKSGVQFITAFANGRRRKDGMVGKEWQLWVYYNILISIKHAKFTKLLQQKRLFSGALLLNHQNSRLRNLQKYSRLYLFNCRIFFARINGQWHLRPLRTKFLITLTAVSIDWKCPVFTKFRSPVFKTIFGTTSLGVTHYPPFWDY